jgi:hypothetical protein
MKKINTLLFFSFCLLLAPLAQAQTASVETEVTVSQQYVDSILNSLGTSAESGFNFSADYAVIGPRIHQDASSALSNFRELMGMLNSSTGLGGAIQEYNAFVNSNPMPTPGPNVDEYSANPNDETRNFQAAKKIYTDALQKKYDVIGEQVMTFESLYQAAITRLYQAQPHLFVVKLDAVTQTGIYADGSTTFFPDLQKQTALEYLNAFPKNDPYDDVNALLNLIKLFVAATHDRYQKYLDQYCDSKYCVTNVMSFWSRYYANVNQHLNRDLIIPLADGQKVTVKGLTSSDYWFIGEKPFVDAITQFQVNDAFLNLPLKVDQWAPRPDPTPAPTSQN